MKSRRKAPPAPLAPLVVMMTLFLLMPLTTARSAHASELDDTSQTPIPPSWQVDNKELYPPQPKRTRTLRPWYQPRVALGVGANLPEVVPLEGWAFFGRHVGLRLFYTPPIPFNIRIEMPSDVISAKKGIGVANPDFTIRMHAIYGPQYGVELLTFPTGGNFFAGAGISYRRMRLTGSAQSPVLVCSLIEAAKDPPCGDPDARIETRTELGVSAAADSAAILGRVAVGGFWHIGATGYLATMVGITKPTRIRSEVDVEATLDTPEADDPAITGALAQVKSEREKDLKSKALRAMRPVEEKPLPILGLSIGLRL